MANKNRYYPVSVQPGIPKLPATPDGWTREPLGKYLVEIKRPVDMADDAQYQLVTVKRSRGGVEERGDFLGKEIKVKSQFYVQSGDFLISKRQIVHGACGIVPDRLDGAIVSGEYAVFGTNGGIDLTYLRHLSESVHFQQTCFHSSIGVHVEKMVFKLDRWLAWDFNIPPLPEQKKIASILTTVYDKISSIENQIQQTEQLKKGLMEKLLTEGIGHTEFKDMKIGRIPKGWGVGILLDLSEIIMGQSPPGTSYNHSGLGVPMLNGPTEFTKTSPRPVQYTTSPTKMCQEQDILFCVRGSSTGRMNIADQEYCIGRGLAAIRQKEHSNTKFIHYVLTKITNKILFEAKGAGSTFPNVSGKDLSEKTVAIPLLAEQKQIANILSTVDDKIEVLTQKKAQYQTLKKGLSQQLLTGQMRVKV